MFLTLNRQQPLGKQIHEWLRQQILDGRLPPDRRLPASRELATELRVSRNTVLRVYEQLIADGYAEGRIGAGTYVCSEFPSEPARASRRRSARRPRLSSFGRRAAGQWREPALWSVPMRAGIRFPFGLGVPDGADFPHDVWRRLLSRGSRHRSNRFLEGLRPEGVYAPLLDALASYLRRTRGHEYAPEQFLVFNGTQHTLDLIIRVLIDPGDSVVIEDPHDTATRRTLLAAGARLAAVPVDELGMDTAKLPRPTLRRRLIFTTPSLQFPTGVRMSAPRRLALLQWAKAADAYVIEGSYDAEFLDRGAPDPIQLLDHDGRVIYIESLVKVMSPIMDLAFVILPADLVDPFRKAKFLIDRHTPALQSVLADFIGEGHYERHVKRTRKRYAARREALLAALDRCLGDRVEVVASRGGLHQLIWLRDVRARQVDGLVRRAADAGVLVHPVRPCYLEAPRRGGLLLGFASLNERQIQAGVRRLAKVIT
jgi:GntR family transcriptional regulator/MocR family aminotransferase